MIDPLHIPTTDRVLAVGTTGSGKTYIMGKLLLTPAVPRLVVVDSKPSPSIRAWPLQPWGPETRRLLANPTAPCRIRIPPQLDEEEYDQLWTELYKYENYCLYNDEVTESTPPRGTKAFRRLLKLGRERGIGMHNGSQRPVDMPRDCTAQAEWILMFRLPLDDDRDRMKKDGIGKAALIPLKEHWYYIYRQGWDDPILCPPWPAPPVASTP